jgi:3-hydroxybutyryl-CoA dehydrogenase
MQMQIILQANEIQKKAFLAKGLPEGIQVVTPETVLSTVPVLAYFDLLWEEQGPSFAQTTDAPVFANAVIATSAELPANHIRINAWNGFLERGLLELAAGPDQQALMQQAEQVLQTLHWSFQWAPDVPGMIAARVIAMIINEAYFGLGDEISTKTEIDIAMKLGTNYPYGPFEWGENIGLKKIHALLTKLAVTGNRYALAPALQNEITLT